MDLSNLKNDLNKKGYSIIPNVLTPHEVSICLFSFKQWQKSIPNHEEFHEKINFHGIYKFHNSGHTWHSWFVRTQNNVQQIFKTLWNCNDLIVSFDGCCYIPKTCKKKDSCWTHTDQSPDSKGLQCYQAFVSFTENKERTFVVYEGTHNDHESYFQERMPANKKNWQPIDEDYLDKIQNKKHVLNVPAGAMVIWDSRVFHQNQYGNSNFNPEERFVQYVCFFPKNHPENTTYMQKKRKLYLETKRTTTHWPCPIKVVNLQPNNNNNKNYFKIDYKTILNPDIKEFNEKIEKLI
tara:strand:+ start:1566 stop:2444 length:879 start_codon:yes stop_codon:yes gene_type:complete